MSERMLMISEWFTAQLEVKTSDSNEQRRARLLNILLLGVLALTAFALLGTSVLTLIGGSLPVESSQIIIPSSLMIAALSIIWAINHYLSPKVGSTLFLIVLTIILYSFAPPYESVWGRNMIMLAIPIVMASVILRPLSSFITAGLIALFFAVISYVYQFPLNYIGVLAYFALALVAWLSASTLENALADLRDINVDLDNKVDERTKELVLTNRQLTEARDAAIVANQYKTELTARVSHELRTPLGAILGFAEMLGEEYYGKVNDNQKQKLGSIIETTKSLSGLISDWLDQARLESGKLELHYQWFDVRDLITYIKNIAQVLIKGKALLLKFEVDPAVPLQLYGDSDRVQQLVINLVSNAIKYTEKGAIDVTVFMADEHWLIQVKDTGIGIPAYALPTIFESFNQVDGSRTRTHEGFGLGLSIVKQLLELMGGDIEVESVVGEGSIFTVILPVVADEESAISWQGESTWKTVEI
jgi:signal transduction histidine kinase